MQGRVGIVLAMESEAAPFGLSHPPVDVPIALNERCRLYVGGIGPAAAQRAAQALCADGVVALASFGVAGALDPGLRAGALLAPHRVVDERGQGFDADAGWHARLLARLQQNTLAAQTAPLLSSASTQATAAAKQARYEGDAIAVDMESAAVAAVARDAGLPFLALRAVTDEAHVALPSAVLDAIDAYGRTQAFALLRALGASPSAALSLPRLGLAFARARRKLATALRHSGPDLAWSA